MDIANKKTRLQRDVQLMEILQEDSELIFPTCSKTTRNVIRDMSQQWMLAIC